MFTLVSLLLLHPVMGKFGLVWFFSFIIDMNFAGSPHGFSFLETASLAPLNHFGIILTLLCSVIIAFT